MFEIIEKLRRKSDRAKKQIAFLCAFFVAGFIFVMWLGVVYPNFKKQEVLDSKVAKLEPSPWTAFGATLSDGISAIGSEFSRLKSTVSSLSTTTYYKASTSPATGDFEANTIQTVVDTESTSTLP